MSNPEIAGLLSVHPEMAIWVEIKACEKFYRRHVVDIPRIKFFA
jgi:hypothetical protein